MPGSNADLANDLYVSCWFKILVGSSKTIALNPQDTAIFRIPGFFLFLFFFSLYIILELPRPPAIKMDNHDLHA